MKAVFFTLQLAALRLCTMAATADDVVMGESHRPVELGPASAVRGRKVFEARLGAAAAARHLTVRCVVPQVGRRSAHASAGVAAVRPVDADGKCGFHSLHASLRISKGIVKAPTEEQLKRDLERSITTHVLGEQHSSATAGTTAVLSADQLTRARIFRATEVINSVSKDVVKGEPENMDEMTCSWLQQRIGEKILEEWLDVRQLAFVSEKYQVNVAVWEPSGTEKNVQLYYQGNEPGLFLCDRKDRMDERGPYWIHLLYHTGDSFRARAAVGGSDGPVMHNHFDWLQLGGDIEKHFVDTIDCWQQLQRKKEDESLQQEKDDDGGSGSLSPPPSPPPSPSPSPRTSPPPRTNKRARTVYPAAPRTTAAASAKRGKKLKTTTVRAGPQAARDAAKQEGSGSTSTKGGRQGKSKKKKPAAAQPAGSPANYDSDQSIGGGDVDWTHTKQKGSFPAVTKSERTMNANLQKVPELPYRAALRRSTLTKMKGDKV